MLSCLKVSLWHLKSWKGSIRIIVVLLMCVAMTVYRSMEYVDYAGSIGGIMNCFETYITVINNSWFGIIMFILTLLMFMDAPFMDNNSLYVVSRIGRYRWCIGKIIYIVIASVILNAIVLGTTMLTSVACSFPGNIWSDTFRGVMEGDAVQRGFDLTFSNMEIQSAFTPMKTALISAGLAILLDCMVGMLLYVFNLINGRVLGCAITSILYFAGYAVSGWEYSKFLPMDNSILVLHQLSGGLTIRWSVIYFCGIIAIATILSLLLIRRVDYKITTGDRV